MKTILKLTILWLAPNFCCAAKISAADVAGAYSLFLNGAARTGAFDTVDVSLRTLSGATFFESR